MKHMYILLLLLPVFSCRFLSSGKKGYDYCYNNGHGWYVARYGNDPVHVYVNGNGASLSPDGTRIAYTDEGAPDHVRRIGVFDLEAGKVSILDTGCHNCYGPMWSPDGSHLVYNAMIGKEWGIKCVDKENKHPVELAVVSEDLLQATRDGGGFFFRRPGVPMAGRSPSRICRGYTFLISMGGCCVPFLFSNWIVRSSFRRRAAFF